MLQLPVEVMFWCKLSLGDLCHLGLREVILGCSQGNTSLYVYEVTAAMVAGSVQNGTQSLGTMAAFQALQPYVWSSFVDHVDT